MRVDDRGGHHESFNCLTDAGARLPTVC
jgi:hypothetical protein